MGETAEELKKRKSREACARYRAKNLEARRAQTREYMAKKRAEDPAWVKANNDRYLEKYPDRLKTRKRKYYQENKANWAPFLARYKAENPEKCAEAIRAWNGRNPEKRKAYDQKSHARPEAKARNCARQSLRNAQKLNATPSWARIEAMQEIYDFAAFMTRESGEPWEVDHTVPLISKIVCGLHCEDNLQVVPAKLNRSKGNRHWANMP